MNRPSGFAVVTVLMMVVVMGVLLASYFVITNLEISTTTQSANSTKGFYAAEAGLNLRAQEVRSKFAGYNVPTGTSPAATNPSQACPTDASGNFTGAIGSGDFQCKGYPLQGRNVATFVRYLGMQTVDPIPPTDDYPGLSAQEYRYDLYSVAKNSKNETEAILQMRFKSRLVPVFQFAVFYNKDLEILPGREMTLSGPVHTNGDLYLDGGTLAIQGRVTTAGDLYRGRKNTNSCNSTVNAVSIANPITQSPLGCQGSSYTAVSQSTLSAWNGIIKTGVAKLTVPAPDTFAAQPGALYWDKADLRLVLNLNNNPPQIQVRTQSNVVDSNATSRLNSCLGTIGSSGIITARRAPTVAANVGQAVGYSNQFYNNRESRTRGTAVLIQMLEVDVQAVMNCIQSNPGQILDAGRTLDDATEGGLVWHFSVSGPNSSGINNYGVRLRNGSTLGSSIPGAPAIKGLTVVSDQAVYTQGDYNSNSSSWKPASILADSLNVLSKNWDNTKENTATQVGSTGKPPADDTTINAAFLAGTDVTGGAEGAAGRNDNYNGGVENYPRFHESWTSKTLTYSGSFVSLGTPQHVNGTWKNQVYDIPGRDWGYETRFNNAANLPPLSPRFVYLKQELFVRQFEQ